MEVTEEMLQKSQKYRLTKDELMKVMISFAENSGIHKMDLSDEKNDAILNAVIKVTLETSGIVFSRHWTDFPEMFDKKHEEHEMMRGEDFGLSHEETDEVMDKFMVNSKLFETNLTKEEKERISSAIGYLLGEVGCKIYDHYTAVHGTPSVTQFRTPRNPSKASIYQLALTDGQVLSLVEKCLLTEPFVILGQRSNVSSEELNAMRNELVDLIMSANALILYEFFGKEEVQKQLLENETLQNMIFGNKEGVSEKKES